MAFCAVTHRGGLAEYDNNESYYVGNLMVIYFDIPNCGLLPR
jgi:hypothetical protein